MADTKPVTFYEFYYPDQRSNGAEAFAANGLIVDHEAGDVVEMLHDRTHMFKQANGREVVVPPGWLWVETYTKQVPKKPTPPPA